MIIVRDAAALVAPFIGKVYPNDRESIFQILDLSQQSIWEAGKFYGSTKWAYVNTRSDNTIITPHGHNSLLCVNIDFKPQIIRDSYCMFHQNGPAESNSFGVNFTNNVQDLGEFPVIGMPERLCTPCEGIKCESFYVGARVTGECREFPKTRIYGTSPNGKNIYSYIKPDTKEQCLCEDEDDIEIWDAIEGVELTLSNTLRVSKIPFGSITGITKEPSNSTVEYYKVDSRNKGTLIASLDPFQITSKYRAYTVPNKCIKSKCIFGLFKRSKPETVINENQAFITDNKVAIIAMAKAMDYLFNRNDIANGNQYKAQGLQSLSNEVKEESSNSVSPIQFIGPRVTESRFG